MNKHLLIIDALNLIRRIYAVDSNQSNQEELAIKNAINRVERAVSKLLKQTIPSHAIAVFDGENSWRYQFYPDYKLNRKPMPEVLQTNLTHFAKQLTNLGVISYFPQEDEADDVIATLADKAAKQHINSTIVSTDKGFLPLLNQHIQVYDYFTAQYVSDKTIFDKFSVNKNQLTEFWALAGDPTNDIPGVKGIGKKTAQTLLAQYPSVTHALASTELNEKIRLKIESELNQYVISKTLATLRVDLPLGFSLKDLRLKRA
ncbi:flap endonuclease Xni [Pseudoalteromonas tunicata]|jgi:protein Xni|uniref:Exonuclease IX n=1 Tax=Pseudoalteromonas tunicata D2 TaxID=87626 RepID=A4C486_9GAMM|nr:flap endonuclease Xni [Pseudoalteromonas tunicata]ATC97151.1 protein Xni [Pseudoalteromonas tunicata]AXT33256.1 flap endonuclease Xni [Pseudoalteromonas tunicata]EAR30368.1 exonuclease IX [Pseudoalteromonas tunicata D2]